MNMKKTLSLIATLLFAVCAMAQSQITLKFSCRAFYGGSRVKPDSITVENLDRNWTETLVYPDTQYVLRVGTGIENVETCHGASLQTTPNPFNGTTTVNLQMSETGGVQVSIFDVNGRTIVEAPYYDASTTYYDASTGTMTAGTHRMRVSLRTPGIYMLNARVNGRTLSAKLVNTGNGGKDAVEFNGIVEAPYYDASTPYYDASTTPKSAKGSSTHPFQLGDRMRYVAYVGNTASEDVTQSQSQSEDVMLMFTILPCLGVPTVTDYDGNVYNTVDIGNQCWMRENLRTTHYANGGLIPAGTMASYDNSYYYDYTTSSLPLSKRGYLYNWMAVMHGANSSNTNPSNVQGVCPNGWHVPSDAEWTELEEFLASWDWYGCGGDNTKTAKALASNEFWSNSTDNCAVGNDLSANNTTGFSAYPVGTWLNGFHSQDVVTQFWSSTVAHDEYVRTRSIAFNRADVVDYDADMAYGLSVRCVRNAPHPAPGDGISCWDTPTVTDYDGNTYHTVQIGNQCWMRENLRTTHYANGDVVPAGTESSSTTPYYYNYSNSGLAMTETQRGYLYNWPAVMHGESSSNTNPSHVQGICPTGWHVPSDAEWTELENYLATQYQYGCSGDNTKRAKALASQEFWNTSTISCAVGNDLSTNNATDFTAYPAGYHQGYTGQGAGAIAEFWTCTQSSDPDRLKMRVLRSYYSDMANSQDYGDMGFSVRCVLGTPQPLNPNDGQPCPGATTVTDYDGNTYNTVQIGQQCWMKENLRTTHYANGVSVPGNISDTSSTSPRYYNNAASSIPLAQRGYLYNWPAVMHGASGSNANPSGVQGICPNGWHVPSDAEFLQLRDYVSSQSQYGCGGDSTKIAKALASQMYWNSDSHNCAVGNNLSTNNATGFSAVPAGGRGITVYDTGYGASIWSSDEFCDTEGCWATYVDITPSSETFPRYMRPIWAGISVRCLKN